MSKRSQRKVSMFNEGRVDGLNNRPYRWIKHPMISVYEAGYRAGEARRILKKRGRLISKELREMRK